MATLSFQKQFQWLLNEVLALKTQKVHAAAVLRTMSIEATLNFDFRTIVNSTLGMGFGQSTQYATITITPLKSGDKSLAAVYFGLTSRTIGSSSKVVQVNPWVDESGLKHYDIFLGQGSFEGYTKSKYEYSVGSESEEISIPVEIVADSPITISIAYKDFF